MSTELRYNIVHFVPTSGEGAGPIAIQLEGPWKLSAGLKPDLNRAMCSYKEFDKLNGEVDLVGNVEFWYTAKPGDEGATPDVVLHRWRIMDVESADIGQPADGTGSTTIDTRIIEYRLFFADFREQFISPRGGRIRLGLVNAGPKPQSSGAAPAPTTNNGVPEMTLSQLMALCLTAMGMPPGVPAGVDAIAAPRDLKWFGNHAPTELAKLLEVAAGTFAPDVSGIGTVVKIVTAGNPVIDQNAEQLPAVELPSMDRRGKIAIFSSYPLPTLETLTLEGPRDDQFYFVVQDSKGIWQKEANCDLLQQGSYSSFIDAWNDNFKKIPADFRPNFANQCLCYLQLGDGSGTPPEGTSQADVRKFPPSSLMPIYTRRAEADGSLQDLQVMAQKANKDPSLPIGNQFVNSAGPIPIPALFKKDSNILQVLSPMVKLPDDKPVADWNGTAVALDPGDITVRFTVPHYVQQSDGSWAPDYHHIGYQRGSAGELELLTDDVVQNALDAGQGVQDAIFILRPDLRLWIIDDDPSNQDALAQLAASVADQYLANSAHPTRILRCKGFVNAEVDGLVSQVEWDQKSLMTILTVNNWYRPGGALDATTFLHAEGSGAEQSLSFGNAAIDYPNQAKMQESRINMGDVGAAQPMLPLTPQNRPEPVAMPAIVNVLHPLEAPEGGFYTGVLYSGTLGSDGTSEISLPEGLSEGIDCVVWNMEESLDQGAAEGTWRLGLNTFTNVVMLDNLTAPTTNPDGKSRQVLAIVNGGTGSTQNPKLLAGSGIIPDSTTWDWGQDGRPLQLTIDTRAYWDGTGGVLYGFSRVLLFDARGVLSSVSAETQYTIFVAVPCS